MEFFNTHRPLHSEPPVRVSECGWRFFDSRDRVVSDKLSVFFLTAEFSAIFQTLIHFFPIFVRLGLGIWPWVRNVILTERQVSVCLFILNLCSAIHFQHVTRRDMGSGSELVRRSLFTA